MAHAGDIETNPGPTQTRATTEVTTYNVRGLNDEKKLRHLINCAYRDLGSLQRGTDCIFLFQETFIADFWSATIYLERQLSPNARYRQWFRLLDPA